MKWVLRSKTMLAVSGTVILAIVDVINKDYQAALEKASIALGLYGVRSKQERDGNRAGQ